MTRRRHDEDGGAGLASAVGEARPDSAGRRGHDQRGSGRLADRLVPSAAAGRSTHIVHLAALFPPSARSCCCASPRSAPRLSASWSVTYFRASRWWDASATGSGGFVTGVLLARAVSADPVAGAADQPPRRQRQRQRYASTGLGRRIAVAALVAAYLTPWGLIKPVLQAPDEPQHLMKANGVRRQPWLTAAAQFEHDPRLHQTPIAGLASCRRSAASTIRAARRSPAGTSDRAQTRALAGRPHGAPGRHLSRGARLVSNALLTCRRSRSPNPSSRSRRPSPYQAICIYRLPRPVDRRSILWAAVYVELRAHFRLAARISAVTPIC